MLSDSLDYVLQFPDDFEGYEWEVESKGWFDCVTLELGGNTYKLSFYDPTRLAQDIKDELEASSLFYEGNLLVIKTVNRANMERAVEALVELNRIGELQSIG